MHVMLNISLCELWHNLQNWSRIYMMRSPEKSIMGRRKQHPWVWNGEKSVFPNSSRPRPWENVHFVFGLGEHIELIRFIMVWLSGKSEKSRRCKIRNIPQGTFFMQQKFQMYPVCFLWMCSSSCIWHLSLIQKEYSWILFGHQLLILHRLLRNTLIFTF